MLVMSVPKLWAVRLHKKCSVNSQLLTFIRIWLLWLFNRMLRHVSLFLTFVSLQRLHSTRYITQDNWQFRLCNILSVCLLSASWKWLVVFMRRHQLHLVFLHALHPKFSGSGSFWFQNFVCTSLSLSSLTVCMIWVAVEWKSQLVFLLTRENSSFCSRFLRCMLCMESM